VNAATLPRDAFAPLPLAGLQPGFGLAVVAHVLLVVALAWGVRWKASEPVGVVAELWAALPQIEAPRPAAAEPRPPEPAPLPRPAEAALAPRQDAQIAIEQARREETERADAARKAELAKRDAAERERRRVADEQTEKQKLVEKAKQEAARQEANRDAYLQRMRIKAGSSDDPNATGSAARTAGPSASYGGQIKDKVRPNIFVPSGSVTGNPLAVVEVRLASDGTIVSQRLVKSSGSVVWDDAVLRAIEKTRVLPRDEGRVYSPMTLEFRPLE
jgi:colicin import membrane protein